MAMRIAALTTKDAVESTVGAYLRKLRDRNFNGEIASGDASRVVFATDNSIYERAPQAVLFPRDADDVALALKIAASEDHREIVFTARGGGTGTNGQSLTDGIVLDLSRHMTGILEVNVHERWVRVQAGVVKDQLNAALKPHGLFFAPELSTSNRATIGGMVNTDASGQGSCIYGKTRDHVLELHTALLGGEIIASAPVSVSEIEGQEALKSSHHHRLARALLPIVSANRELIRTVFPKLNRCLTGYDLAHLVNDEGVFDLNSVICGSEGTLGVVVEAKLNLLPIPKHTTLVNIRYDGFMSALRDARTLIGHHPLSIETIDSRVLERAMDDVTWHDVAAYFPSDPACPTRGINIVEFSGDSEQDVARNVDAFCANLTDVSAGRLGFTRADGKVAASHVYAMRKRAVGLLGNVQGAARPQPFVEDAAVPPENLADFIAEFRALLDRHGLEYGMFGHVDAGVLHVRPLLDLRQARDRALIEPISDEVAALTQKYGGLLWGEHGKGLRSVYVPKFFGPLYPALQHVKALFDPYNQLNPGKIATPVTLPEAQLSPLMGVPLRADSDRAITSDVWASFGAAMHCNGNGACYNYNADDPMCPSWKGTRDRRFSPKGRAQLMKAWLKRQAAEGIDIARLEKRLGARLFRPFARREGRGSDDFSHEVYRAMTTCLACKSCTSQCPVHVDVPDLRARFLSLYHARFRRPLKDYLLAGLEPFLFLAGKVPHVFNSVTRHARTELFVRRCFGLVDIPRLATKSLRRACLDLGVQVATKRTLGMLSETERARSVVFVADAFIRQIAQDTLIDAMRSAHCLGYKVFISQPIVTGKPLHVYGFMGAFNAVARHTARHLRWVSGAGVALVGIDPALTLVFRQEYRKVPRVGEVPHVKMLQEWLLEAVSLAPKGTWEPLAESKQLRLLLHCTEKTSLPDASQQWIHIFERLGLELSVVSAGCCGMSGAFGHEAANVALSRNIFDLSWGKILDRSEQQTFLATGFSCRSQVQRLRDQGLAHPISVVATRLATLQTRM